MKNERHTKDVWNADLYDTRHSFISKYGDHLLDLLAPKAGEKILDLGCGTGDLAKKLYDAQVDVVGVDNSANMVAQAKKKYPSITFEVQNATELDFHNEFDAVFSNAVLHWVPAPKQVLTGIYQSLQQGGRFIAEFGGKGNVQAISNGIIQGIQEAGFDYNIEQFPWYFPSIGEYTALMEEAGFRVTLAQHYDRPTPLDGNNGLRDWIVMFGSAFFTGIAEHDKNDILTTIEQQLRPLLYTDGQWVADYKRIRVVGIKEK